MYISHLDLKEPRRVYQHARREDEDGVEPELPPLGVHVGVADPQEALQRDRQARIGRSC